MYGEAEAIQVGSFTTQTSTEDALGRPRTTTVDHKSEKGTASHYLTSLDADARPSISTCIYDTEVIDLRNPLLQLSLFQSFANFTTPTQERKAYGADCNLHGNGGCLPAGQTFVAKGISVIIPEFLIGWDSLFESVSIHLETTIRTLFVAPLKSCIPKERVAFGESEGSIDNIVKFTGTAPAVMPFSFAYTFPGLEYFQVRLLGFRQADVAPFRLKVILHGNLFYPGVT